VLNPDSNLFACFHSAEELRGGHNFHISAGLARLGEFQEYFGAHQIAEYFVVRRVATDFGFNFRGDILFEFAMRGGAGMFREEKAWPTRASAADRGPPHLARNRVEEDFSPDGKSKFLVDGNSCRVRGTDMEERVHTCPRVFLHEAGH
jgi:hypothetical protein